MHVLEWFIEHHTLSPEVARRTVEDQRRRILFELEAPIPPPAPTKSSTRPRRPVSQVDKLQNRINALRRQMAVEGDPGRRMAIKDQLVDLGKQLKQMTG